MEKISLKVISILIITLLFITIIGSFTVSACVPDDIRIFSPAHLTLDFYRENLADFSDTQNSWKELVALATIDYDFRNSDFILPDFREIEKNTNLSTGEGVLRFAAEILSMVSIGLNPFDRHGWDLVQYFTNVVGSPENADMIATGLQLNETLVIFYTLNAVDRLEYFEHFIPRILELQTDYGWGEDSDMVSMTILALQPYAEQLPEVANAMALAREYLVDSQLPDGGFLSSPLWGNESNANSTAMAILAINALGENPFHWMVYDIDESGRHPIASLINSFRLDDGSFGADFGDGLMFNEIATRDAFLALAAMELGGNVFTNMRNRELANWDFLYCGSDHEPVERTGNNLYIWIIIGLAVAILLFVVLLVVRRRVSR